MDSDRGGPSTNSTDSVSESTVINRCRAIAKCGFSNWEWIAGNVTGLQPRWGHTSCVHRGFLYIFGGVYKHGHNDTYRFCPQTRQTSVIPTQGEIPEKRHDHVAVVVDDFMYIFGGRCNSDSYNSMYRLNLTTYVWEKVLPSTSFVPSPRSGAAAVVYQHVIYMFGGYSGRVYYKDLLCFDTRTNTWSEIKPVRNRPPGRSKHTLTLVGTCLYLIGGYDNKHYFDEVNIYNLQTVTWSKIVSPSTTRPRKDGLSMSPLMSDSGAHPGSSTLDQGVRELMLNPEFPPGRSGLSTVLFGDSLLVTYGGIGKFTWDKNSPLWVFDTVSERWISQEWLKKYSPSPLPNKAISTGGSSSGASANRLGGPNLFSHTANVVGNQMIVFAGCDPDHTYRDMYILSLDEGELGGCCRTLGSSESVSTVKNMTSAMADPSQSLSGGMSDPQRQQQVVPPSIPAVDPIVRMPHPSVGDDTDDDITSSLGATSSVNALYGAHGHLLDDESSLSSTTDFTVSYSSQAAESVMRSVSSYSMPMSLEDEVKKSRKALKSLKKSRDKAHKAYKQEVEHRERMEVELNDSRRKIHQLMMDKQQLEVYLAQVMQSDKRDQIPCNKCGKAIVSNGCLCRAQSLEAELQNFKGNQLDLLSDDDLLALLYDLKSTTIKVQNRMKSRRIPLESPSDQPATASMRSLSEEVPSLTIGSTNQARMTPQSAYPSNQYDTRSQQRVSQQSGQPQQQQVSSGLTDIFGFSSVWGAGDSSRPTAGSLSSHSGQTHSQTAATQNTSQWSSAPAQGDWRPFGTIGDAASQVQNMSLHGGTSQSSQQSSTSQYQQKQ